jgi:hypothetical protein
MSFPIIINSTNRISSNQYKISLSSTLDLTDFQVAVGNAFIYYSWTNINAYPLNNNSFQIAFPNYLSGALQTLTIPDGTYNISDLNNYLQYWMISKGLYLINTVTNQNLYYMNLSVNPVTYKIQLNTYPLPTSLPSGYTSGGMSFPAVINQHPQILIFQLNNFKNLIGFNQGIYPPNITNVGTYTKESDYIPNVNPINSIQVRLSCVYNPFSVNSQIIHCFSNKDAAVGTIIDASPLQLQYVPCTGSHKELLLSFFDQNGNVLNIQDPNLTIKLIFRHKDKSEII